MLHDGSWVKLRKVAEDYDATDRDAAYAHIREHQREGEVVTGLLYISPDSQDVHDQNETVAAPLYNLPHDQLCPGNDALQKLMGSSNAYGNAQAVNVVSAGNPGPAACRRPNQVMADVPCSGAPIYRATTPSSLREVERDRFFRIVIADLNGAPATRW